MKKLTDATKTRWSDKLKEIEQLQFEYRLPPNLVQMLTLTHNLDEIPKIIKWNVQKLH